MKKGCLRDIAVNSFVILIITNESQINLLYKFFEITLIADDAIHAVGEIGAQTISTSEIHKL